MAPYYGIISMSAADSGLLTFCRTSLEFGAVPGIFPSPREHPMKTRGFTLIELMIAVAVIAILVAVALPSYREYLKKGHRGAAQTFMLDIANREQQYLLDTRTYTATVGSGGLNLAPSTDLASRYTFAVAVVAGPPPSFTITATALGSQATDGDLTLDNQGNKTPTNKW
jgi:type IV pilus assembly protein PilE